VKCSLFRCISSLIVAQQLDRSSQILENFFLDELMFQDIVLPFLSGPKFVHMLFSHDHHFVTCFQVFCADFFYLTGFVALHAWVRQVLFALFEPNFG
jgi:hypothetical protein